MNILLTESQYRNLRKRYVTLNDKPARIFDEIYGTNIGKTYDFGNGMASDEIWGLWLKCRDKDDCDEFGELAKNLNEKMFPYQGVSSLDLKTKFEILMGMASEFNVADIIHFSIHKVYHGQNVEVNDFLSRLPEEVQDNIQWVVSPTTLNKMKPVLMQFTHEF